MTTVGLENLDLVKYLVSQVMMSDEDRLNELRKYYPDAKAEDWRLSQGGQRVQIIKKNRVNLQHFNSVQKSLHLKMAL